MILERCMGYFSYCSDLNTMSENTLLHLTEQREPCSPFQECVRAGHIGIFIKRVDLLYCVLSTIK